MLGFGCAGGIPMADIAAWMSLFPPENPRRFVEYIRALDGEYLDFSRPRDKAEE